jgi:Na+-transporting methylmalonyl-CoA/oxaloacetate decarboxylase gamma subunit
VKVNKYVNLAGLVLIFLMLIVGLFYLLPQLAEKSYPPPKSAQYVKLQEKINQQGYLTEADVKLMNMLGDQELQRVKEQEESKFNFQVEQKN